MTRQMEVQGSFCATAVAAPLLALYAQQPYTLVRGESCSTLLRNEHRKHIPTRSVYYCNGVIVITFVTVDCKLTGLVGSLAA